MNEKLRIAILNDRKIDAIKILRVERNMGLKEAADYVQQNWVALIHEASAVRKCSKCGRDPTLPEPCPTHNPNCPYIYS